MQVTDVQLPEFLTNPDPSIFLSDNYLVLDFETTNKDKGDPVRPDNSIVLGTWKFAKDPAVYYIYGNEFEQHKLVHACETADYIVAHNSKFELQWLARCGLDLQKTIAVCTQIAEYTVTGNNYKRQSLKLDDVLQRRQLGSKESVVSKLLKLGICPSVIPKSWLIRYGCTDTAQTEKLWLQQRQELFDKGLEKIFYTRCLLTPVLADIETNGIHLDNKRVQHVYNQFYSRLKSLREKMAKITGGINTGSPKQLAEFLFSTLGFDKPRDQLGNPIVTEGGQPSTSEEALGTLKARNKRQSEFLELKRQESGLKSAVEKTLTKFKECCDANTIDRGNKQKAIRAATDRTEAILYASFNQTIAKTARLSSTGKKPYNVQLQNLDRRFKPLMSPRNPGWFIGEADEAQLEFRTAVWLGDDETGKQDIADNFDVHSYTASIIYPDVKDRKAARQDAKADTFKPLYGGVSGTPTQKEYYQAFKDKYRGIANAQDAWIEEVLGSKDKSMLMPTGQRFFHPHAKITNTGWIEGNTNIRNFPVQYLATGEIVPIALIFAWHYFKLLKLKSFIVNTVHDSIIGEIHPKEVELFKEITVQALEKDCITYLWDLYKIDFDVPLEAEVDTNKFWTNNEKWEQEYLK